MVEIAQAVLLYNCYHGIWNTLYDHVQRFSIGRTHRSNPTHTHTSDEEQNEIHHKSDSSFHCPRIQNNFDPTKWDSDEK